MRYEIHVIADVDCTSIHDEALAQADDLSEAGRESRRIAGEYPYGTAILDTQTREIDWGFGFGVPVPEPDAT